MSHFRKSSRLIFKSFSLVPFLKLLIARIGILFFIGYALINFNKNPIVIAVFVTVLVILFLASGEERIEVYDDEFVYRSDSILGIFALRKRINFNQIKRVSSYGNHTKLSEVFTLRGQLWNRIDIEYKNEEIASIRTMIYIEDLQKAVNIVNERVTGLQF